MCSNLAHFAYLVKIIEQTNNIQSIDYPIKIHGYQKASVRVDIITDNGRTWIKVIARNPKALNDIAFGRSNYGAKSILDHAKCYIEAAENNPYCFKSPTVNIIRISIKLKCYIMYTANGMEFSGLH